ncbi:hypothetical protein AN641_03675 [Candidatus Epulonipiscioides gigas]|nr:hypothetical protein AN641_03675 [Epulopiscium sp. SCG-C07WGA-EpuloA2]
MLREIRIKRNLSQRQVAQEIGVTTPYYTMLETQNRKPSLLLAYKLAKLFNCTIEELFFNESFVNVELSNRLVEILGIPPNNIYDIVSKFY